MLPLRNLKRFINKAMGQPLYALAVGRKRLEAYCHYYLGRGRSSPPEAITFFLTRLCNLRCKMCGQWGDFGASRAANPDMLTHWLDLEEIRRVLNEVSFFKPNITLFGGEPLMHPDIVEIVRLIKKFKLHCLMITNGSMLVFAARDLVEAGLDELNISIDGDRGLHDEIRGLPGVYDKIMEGIDAVNEAKRARSALKPLINIQCTITSYNYDRLEVMIDVARRAKANALTFHNLIFLTKDLIEKQKMWDDNLACSSREWGGFVFEPNIDPNKLFEKLKKVKVEARLEKFSVDFFPNFSKKGTEDYYKNPDYLPSEYAPKCLSPWVCAYIFPEGDLRPCLNCTYSFGNVKTESFVNIWNSPKAVRYRQALKKEGIFPVCRRCTELYRY